MTKLVYVFIYIYTYIYTVLYTIYVYYIVYVDIVYIVMYGKMFKCTKLPIISWFTSKFIGKSLYMHPKRRTMVVCASQLQSW